MNPYKFNTKRLKLSKPVTGPLHIIKLELAGLFITATEKMSPQEIINICSLHKADISRIRTHQLERFSIDRLIKLLDLLGFTTKLQISKKSA